MIEDPALVPAVEFEAAAIRDGRILIDGCDFVREEIRTRIGCFRNWEGQVYVLYYGIFTALYTDLHIGF